MLFFITVLVHIVHIFSDLCPRASLCALQVQITIKSSSTDLPVHTK